MSGETDNNNALEEGQEQNIENHDSEDTSSDQQQQQQQKIIKEKKHDAGAADLERVTDYAEEREISESDISGVSKATNLLIVSEVKLGLLNVIDRNVLTSY